MKQIISVFCIITVIASCNISHKSKTALDIEQYAVVNISAMDLSGITDNGKEVLNLYRFAADEADKIYWKQYFGDKSLMEGIKDEYKKEYAMINYGPWDRLTGKSFIDGYDARPAGANFYPDDMTSGEFDALKNSEKLNPYTLIKRGENGELKCIWYHDEYKENIDKISSYLQAAADITIKESVRNYLLKKIEALKTDDFYESDLAWLDMTDSKMDLIIGPNENNDDQLYGVKTSYEAFVLLKNINITERLSKYTGMLSEFQKSLPCPDEYKTFAPGSESNIFAYDAIYYAGNANAGVKVIAINLPYDTKVQREKGTRTVLLRNIMEQKFNMIVYPTGVVLFNTDQASHLDADAFFWNIACREIAHGLGVKNTINGKGTVSEALGKSALLWEEMKGSVVGLYISCSLIDRHETSALLTRNDAITTYIASLIRSQRFGEAEALGRSNIIIYNYLLKDKAIARKENGKYFIDYKKAYSSLTTLAGIILKTQATGDIKFASDFEKEYGQISDAFKADLVNLRLEKIPVDIRFTYSK